MTLKEVSRFRRLLANQSTLISPGGFSTHDSRFGLLFRKDKPGISQVILYFDRRPTRVLSPALQLHNTTLLKRTASADLIIEEVEYSPAPGRKVRGKILYGFSDTDVAWIDFQWKSPVDLPVALGLVAEQSEGTGLTSQGAYVPPRAIFNARVLAQENDSQVSLTLTCSTPDPRGAGPFNAGLTWSASMPITGGSISSTNSSYVWPMPRKDDVRELDSRDYGLETIFKKCSHLRLTLAIGIEDSFQVLPTLGAAGLKSTLKDQQKNAVSYWQGHITGSLPKNFNSSDALALHTLLSNVVNPQGLFGTERPCFPSRASYACHFLWDTFFQSLPLIKLAPRLVRDGIIILARNQTPEGKIPQFVCARWIRPNDSQTPLISWLTEAYMDGTGDRSLLPEIYQCCKRSVNWWFARRNPEGIGLISIMGGLETGWDDSPMYDSGPVASVDTNSILFDKMNRLSRWAQALGFKEEAIEWKSRAKQLQEKMLRFMRDPKTGLLFPYNIVSRKRVQVLTPASFYPHLTGVVSKAEGAAEQIRNILLNPSHFWGEYPFPCVAFSDSTYDPNKWWRGPVWVPVAFLMVQVLRRWNFVREADQATDKLLRMISRSSNFRELFNSQTGEGMGSAEQGWTAALWLQMHCWPKESLIKPDFGK